MRSTTKRLAAALVALTVAAPVAAAQPLQQTAFTSDAPAAAPTAPATKSVVVVRDNGFDWTDAAVGGAIAAGLFGIAGAGMLVARRNPSDAGPALGAH